MDSYKYEYRCITIGHKSPYLVNTPTPSPIKNIPERNIPKKDPFPDPTKLQFK